MSNYDKLHAYKSYLENKLAYVLVVTSLAYVQCQELDKLIAPLLLNSHSIQQHVNRNIIYLSDEFGGLNILTVYHLQGIAKLQFLHLHYRNHDTTGKLLKISMKYTQLECGLSDPFYKHDFYKVQHLITPTLTTNLWQYTTESHCSIHEQHSWQYKFPRVQDAYIMDIIQASDLSQEHQEIFNRIRLNLRLLTLSDMVVADSTSRLLPDLLKGINHRKSKLNWPTEQQLPPSWMNIFRHTIQHVIRPHLLNKALGKWTHDGHQLWIHSSHPDTNYETIPPCLHKHKQPVDITQHKPRPVIGYRPPTHYHVAPPTLSLPPLSAIHSSPYWMHRLWSGIDWKVENINTIIENLTCNRIYMTADGYVKDCRNFQIYYFPSNAMEIQLDTTSPNSFNTLNDTTLSNNTPTHT